MNSKVIKSKNTSEQRKNTRGPSPTATWEPTGTEPGPRPSAAPESKNNIYRSTNQQYEFGFMSPNIFSLKTLKQIHRRVMESQRSGHMRAQCSRWGELSWWAEWESVPRHFSPQQRPWISAAVCSRLYLKKHAETFKCFSVSAQLRFSGGRVIYQTQMFHCFGKLHVFASAERFTIFSGFSFEFVLIFIRNVNVL